MVHNVQPNMVFKIRVYKKKFPEHWSERKERRDHMGRLVTIKSIGDSTNTRYGRIDRYPILELWIKETSYPWYSDDLVKANRLR
jgi:hypothetical protein